MISRRTGKVWMLLVAVSLLCAQPVAALEVSGLVTGSSAGSFSIEDLQRLPASMVTVGTDTYTGVSLWSLLGGNAAGTSSNITTVGGGNNPILRNYVLASGAGGPSLLSVGEFDPFFGGTTPFGPKPPYLVAYAENGATLSTPLLVVPQDLSETRWVNGLTQLTVGAVPRPPVGPGGTTTQFTLGGVQQPGIYSGTTLQALPQTTLTAVQFVSGAGSTVPGPPHDYSGVSIWTLLSAAGIPSNQLTSYFLATGSDGFQVLFSLAELNPVFGAVDGIVATSVDGGSLGSAGFARLVIPGDNHGGRFVSNLAALEVASVPEPPTMVLFGSRMLGLGLAGWRWRRTGHLRARRAEWTS